MILDRAPDAADPVCDVCVVGSGPVGISLALEVARLGHSVVLIESGGDSPDPAVQALSEARLADPARHDPMSAAIARRLGGTSTLWGGRCLPLDPIDFESRLGTDAPLWPIGYDAIQQYISRACDYAGCGSAIFEQGTSCAAGSDGRFSMTSLERWSTRPRFQRVYRSRLADDRRIRVHLNTTAVGFVLDDSDRVSGIQVAGADGVRQRLDATDFVLCAGGIETARLLLALQRDRPTTLGGAGGALGRYYMGHLTGEISDVEFANDAIDQEMDFFVDGHGSYARRRFVPSRPLQRAHALTNIAFWPVVPPIADARHGSGPLSAIALALSAPVLGRRLLPEAIRRRHMPQVLDRRAHLRNVVSDAAGSVGFLPRFAWRRLISSARHPGLYLRNARRRYGLSYHAEHLPHADSRVTLTDEVDRLGLPRAAIDLRFHREDAEPIARSHALLADWMQQSGLGRVEYRGDPRQAADLILAQASHGTHQIGLTRMGDDPRHAVVDANLRCFGFDNLHVASSAVFPTSGQANPTLTTIALALRLAAHLATSRSDNR